jgi:HAE1 family hydrophobic/amphiphilic exporter-1
VRLLTRLSLKSGAVVVFAALLVTAGGVFAVTQLKQELIPSIELPVLAVVTPYPGATPDVVESELTTPVEDALRGVPGLESTLSSSTDGVSLVALQFGFGVDIGDVRQRVSAAVEQLRARLPEGARDSTVREFSFDQFPVIAYAISSDLPAAELAARLERTAVPALAGIEGVSSVELLGAGDRVVQLSLRPQALARAGLTVADVATAISSSELVQPLGRVAFQSGDAPLPLEISSRVTSLAELRAVPVVSAAGQAGAPTIVGDLADVDVVELPAETLVRVDGRPALGLQVTKLNTATTVAVVDDVSSRVAELEPELGAETQATVLFDQAEPIRAAIDAIVREGGLGILFAVLIIFVFLRSARATVVAAVSIPLSLVIALLALWQQGFSLNVLTLGALTVAVGRVVDDSIVVLENIYRHVSEGDPVLQAAYTGTREVGAAITASTLTTVAVFMPIALVGGIAGEIFGPFALTVVIALLASLLVAFTVVPLFAARTRREDTATAGLLQRAYLPIIGWGLRRRWITIAIGAALFFSSLALTPLLKQNLFDQSASPVLTVTVEMPAGSSVAETDAEVAKIERLLAGVGGVESVSAQVGVSADPFAAPGTVPAAANRAQVQAILEEGAYNAAADVIEPRLERYRGPAEVAIDESGGGGPASNAVEVQVKATDPAVLARAAAQVQAALEDVPELTDVENDLAATRPELELRLDRAAAAAAGVAPQVAAAAVSSALQGQSAGTIELAEGTLDVRLTSSARGPLTRSQLLTLPVPGARGQVELDEIAGIVETESAESIQHVDGERAATISAVAAGDDLGAARAAFQEQLDALDLPAGAEVETGGAFADLASTQQDLFLAILAAIALVYLVMVATFRSLLKPLLLLVSIPFAITGALIALVVTGTSLSLPALIGVLMLIGIVVTNAIVLLDLVEQYRERGYSVYDSLVEGASRRLRPVLMTALATMLALLPLALGLGGGGGGGFIGAPLAIVVIGGLVSSTLLTLVLVPVLYSLTARFTRPRQGRELDAQFDAAAAERFAGRAEG